MEPQPSESSGQGVFATMDIELWALVLDHADRLSLPPAFFVSRRLRDAVRYRRRARMQPRTKHTAKDIDNDDGSDVVVLPTYALQQHYVALLVAAGEYEMTRWAVDAMGCAMPSGMCRRVAATGNLDFVKWARNEKQCLWDGAAVAAAARTGCVDVVLWLMDNGCPWHVNAVLDRGDVHTWLTHVMLLLFCVRTAPDAWIPHLFARVGAKVGSLECVAMACARDRSVVEVAATHAVSHGRISVLEWLWDNHASDPFFASKMNAHGMIMFASAVKGAGVRCQTTEWLIDHGCTYTTGDIADLGECGGVDALARLWERRERDGTTGAWDGSLYRRAARRGHLDVVKWLDAMGVPWHDKACCDAVGGHHLPIIKWAKARGHTWREGICDEASRVSDVAILAWAYDKHGCPWSERARRKACTAAARNNNFDAMRWAFARGSPIKSKTVPYAVHHGRIDILEWIDVHATINWASQRFLCGDALGAGHLDVVAWLVHRGASWHHWRPMTCDSFDNLRRAVVDYGCPLEWTMCTDAAGRGDLRMLMWLRARGCPWGADVCQYAAQNGHLAVLQWARQQGCPWSWGIDSWAQHGDPEILEWILSQDDRPQPTPEDEATDTLIAQMSDSMYGDEWMPTIP